VEAQNTPSMAAPSTGKIAGAVARMIYLNDAQISLNAFKSYA
jgi:hypothetical protein